MWLAPTLGRDHLRNLNGSGEWVASSVAFGAFGVKSVTVVTPTLNRPGPLRRAGMSVLGQTGLAGRSVEWIVADNSADGSADHALDGMAASQIAFRVIRARELGVASARNAGVAAASGDWIAFLDDDEEASPTWLSELLRVAEASGADAAFGPIVARAESGAPRGAIHPYFERTLECSDGADITDLVARLGCNNSMFSRARCLAGAGPFDTRLNQSGGEDSLLLMQAALDGRRFVYAAGATVAEWVPDSRLNWSYVRRRRFLSGQIRVFTLTMTRPARWGAALKWMGIGAGQALVSLALALTFWAMRDEPGRQRALAYCASGLGKVLWRRGWRPKLYGEGHVS